MKMPKSCFVALAGAVFSIASVDAAILFSSTTSGTLSLTSASEAGAAVSGYTWTSDYSYVDANGIMAYLRTFADTTATVPVLSAGNAAVAGSLNVGGSNSGTPNNNIGSGGGNWNVVYGFHVGEMGSDILDFDKLTIGVAATNGSGAYQGSTQYRPIRVTAQILDDNSTVLKTAILTGTDQGAGGYGLVGALTSYDLDMSGLAIVSDAYYTLKLTFDHDPAGPSTGTFAALGSVTLSATTPIPEPSTYAMIAGIGALGLVVMRRRKN
ncbi:MAG: PEP-CTERM sorting domain-containing protein [Puniceicoccales bacterium]|jgi:hypothetical protein|nr:PEP-CTERM sorting domain-containing protein [Puniceicoccales bacterium]